MKKNNHGFAPIIILVLIALAVVGYFGYKNYWPKSQTPVITSPFPTVTADPTANWKTYTSKYQYTIKYPPGFTVQTGDWKEGNIQYGLQAEDEVIVNFIEPNQPPHGGFLYGTNISLKTPINNPQQLGAVEWAQNQANKLASNLSSKFSVQPITIAGIAAAKISYILEAHITEIYIPGQGKMYEIVFADFLPTQASLQDSSFKLSYNYEDIYNQILSTFKFTQ